MYAVIDLTTGQEQARTSVITVALQIADQIEQALAYDSGHQMSVQIVQ
jgi:hypothetical protein